MSFLSAIQSSCRAVSSWSANAQDLIYKRFLPQRNMTISQWVQEIANKASQNYLKDRDIVRKEYFELLHGKFFFPTSAALHNSISGKGSLSGCIVVPLSNHPQDVIEKDLPKMTQLLMKGIGVGIDLSPLPPRLHPDAKTGRCHSGPIETLKALTSASAGLVDHGGVKKPAYMGALSALHPDIAPFIALKRDHKLSSVNTSVSIDSAFKEALSKGSELPFTYTLNGEPQFLTVKTFLQMKTQARKRDVPGPDLEISFDGSVRSKVLDQVIGSVKNGILCENPQKLVHSIARVAHGCGDPGILDLETINRHNPTHSRYSKESMMGVGEIAVTTPCGEQPLLPYEVCHLGSFNLSAFVENGRFDFELFRKAIPVAVRLMDDLIELSDNGLEEANEISRANRKIGIGVMGLADALAQQNLPYNSPEGLAMAEKIASVLSSTTQLASERLAMTRGAFKTFAVSKYAFHEMKPRRHATLTTIAPTGHISILADCSSGIEPYFRITFGRKAAGIRIHENKILKEKLEQIGTSLEEWIAHTKRKNPSFTFDGTLRELSCDLFLEEKKNAYLELMKTIFVTSGEISPSDHLKIVAIFQKYVDNGVSKTINLPHNATVEDVLKIFEKAIDLQLKGITVYRDRCQETQALFLPGECVTCDIKEDTSMVEAEYTHMLVCLDHLGKVKYKLPAIIMGEINGYWIYSRPLPIIHHHVKQKKYILNDPELILVSKKGYHCISISFANKKATNMYININHPPEESKNGHEWRDLELDIRLAKQPDGSWGAKLLDEDEFIAADLKDEERKIAQDEAQRILNQIENRAFPFCDDLSQLEKLL